MVLELIPRSSYSTNSQLLLFCWASCFFRSVVSLQSLSNQPDLGLPRRRHAFSKVLTLSIKTISTSHCLVGRYYRHHFGGWTDAAHLFDSLPPLSLCAKAMLTAIDLQGKGMARHGACNWTHQLPQPVPCLVGVLPAGRRPVFGRITGLYEVLDISPTTLPSSHYGTG